MVGVNQSVACIILLIMFHMSVTVSEMDSSSKDQTNAGILGGQKVVDFLSKLGDPKEDKIFDSLGKMAGFLGAAGGLISFALLFVPSSESAELRYMKLKFAEVNMKLDRITTVLDDVKDLITYENQRSIYVQHAAKILYGHKRLNEFLTEIQQASCTGNMICKRIRARIASRYVDSFDIKESLFTIINGATKKTSAFGDPLLQVIKKTFKCDTTKLDHFSASLLKLSFKAQQVILAHEKLTGSTQSITQSMNDWLKMLYGLRDTTFRIKSDCFKNINTYMIADITNTKYQVGVSSNNQAVKELKGHMVGKYPWLGWIIYSYNQYGGSKHCITNNYGAFWSMPKGTNNRKRNVIAAFVDKKGTYTNQKYKVMRALDDIVAKTDFYSVEKDACKIQPIIIRELRKRGVYKYVISFNILRKYEDFQISADNKRAYIDQEYTLSSTHKGYRGSTYTHKDKVRLIIVMKSEENAAGAQCTLDCNNKGSCQMLPYASTAYCQCHPYYQGDACKNHSKAELAKTIDAMLAVTLKLPFLSDIAYDIADLRNYIGISFGATQAAISELEKTLTNAFTALHNKIDNQFQWANLITHYSYAIKMIKYYSYRFEYLPEQYPKSTDKEGKKLAASVLVADGIQKWLYELNFLFLGRSGTPLLSHKPMMFVFMEKYNVLACSQAYKAAVDNTWQQLLLLQQIGYMVWVQSLAFQGQSTERAKELYKRRTAAQVELMKQKTCEYSIANSENIQCAGGFYLHPGMRVKNKCLGNFYVNGSLSTSCESKKSKCEACKCNPGGSERLQCEGTTGKCTCKPGFYGDKCTHHDCVLGAWSGWSKCSKSCDHGGVETRIRSARTAKLGDGKSCTGPVRETKSCYQGCCPQQFHCKPRNTCINRPTCRCSDPSCQEKCIRKVFKYISDTLACIMQSTSG